MNEKEKRGKTKRKMAITEVTHTRDKKSMSVLEVKIFFKSWGGGK